MDDEDLPPVALEDEHERRGRVRERRIGGWVAAILISQLVAVAVVVAVWVQIRQDIDALEVRLAKVEAASKEQQRIPVPDVEGLRVQEAMAILGAAGFLPVVDARTSDGVRVVGQRPPAGDRVLSGIRVVVTLGNPEGEAVVPKVTGLRVHTAMAALSALGFRVSVDDWDPSRSDMVVVAQEPPGDRSRRGRGTRRLTRRQGRRLLTRHGDRSYDVRRPSRQHDRERLRSARLSECGCAGWTLATPPDEEPSTPRAGTR